MREVGAKPTVAATSVWRETRQLDILYHPHYPYHLGLTAPYLFIKLSSKIKVGARCAIVHLTDMLSAILGASLVLPLWLSALVQAPGFRP